MIITIDMDVVRQKVEDRRIAWEKAKANLIAVKAYASKNHVSPGTEYWQEEHRLRSKYENVKAIYEALLAGVAQ